jgi:hypothetical protein
MSFYILRGLFQYHIHVIGLHGHIKNIGIRRDYSKKADIARGYIAASSSLKVIYIMCYRCLHGIYFGYGIYGS